MAKIDILRQARAPQTASVYIRTSAVTSSLTGEFELEFVPITGVSGSVNAAEVSGALGPNATLIRSLNASKISGSFGLVSSSLASRLDTAEAELELTLLSGSSQVKSLLPAGTISSSAQINSLPRMVDRTFEITQIGGANVKSLVNESNLPILNDKDVLQWSAAEGKFTNAQRILAPSLSFDGGTNALAIEGQNSVDLSSLSGGGGGSGGSGLALTASNEGSALSQNVRSINFVGSNITASNSGNAVTVTLNETRYDGNRVMTNPNLGELYNNNFNAGTSGSIVDFLNGVFFTNTAPSISSSRLTIGEFEEQTTVVGTISATDAEQSFASGTLSFSTGSYSDAIFKIHSSSGQITVELGKHTTSSLNTQNRGDGVLAHPFPVTISDTFVTSSATIFIRVTPNTAPVFRTTSVAGSIITSNTGSVNENTTNGTQVLEFFVTDSESDTITISPLSQSSDNLFSMTTANVGGGKRIRINTASSSFDYESATSHLLYVSASDNHHGNTSGSYLTTLPIVVNVTDNVAPTMAAQSFTVREDSGSYVDNGLGAASNTQKVVGNITTNDSEGDTVTFTALSLVSGPGTGNTSQTDVANDPFQVSSTGQLQLKAGQYLNADVHTPYTYNASYRDNFNQVSSSGLITINISPEPVPTLSSNGTFYIIESAVSGALVRTNSNGRSGTVADFNSTATVSMSVSSSGFFDIVSSGGTQGNLSIKTNVSGSSFLQGSTILGAVSASTAYGTTATASFSVNVAINNAPVPSFSNTSANLNTNGARPSNTLTTITFSDAESDTLDHNTFTFTDPSGQLNTNKVGDTYQVRASTNLSASAYEMTASIKDEHGFRTGTTKHDITIAAASTGTLTTNGAFYVRDSFESGDNIVLDSEGDPTGTQGDLGVTYSPQYNSQAVAAFTSSNSDVAVASNGNLTLGGDMGGAGRQAGDTFTSNITWQDQFGNVGGPTSITINVVAAPNLVYGYGWRGGSSVGEATTMASMGDNGADEVDVTSGSFIAMLQSGSIGSNFTPSFVGGLATLHKSASLSTMSDSNSEGISTLGYFNFAASERLCIIFPSSSAQGGRPASMYDGVPPDSTGTTDEYYVYAKDASIPGTIATGIYYFNLETAINGVSRWGMIFAEGKNTNNSRYFLMPDSASAP